MFQPGDRVICIDDTIRPEWADENAKYFRAWIHKDREYTVRDAFGNEDIARSITLEGLHNENVKVPVLNGKVQEASFAEWRFELAPETIEPPTAPGYTLVAFLLDPNTGRLHPILAADYEA